MEKAQFVVVTISRHIKLRFKGNQAGFARSQGVLPQQVTKWINAGWVIGGGYIFSPKREDKQSTKQSPASTGQ